MTVVLSVPETLDERGFETLVAGWASAESGQALFDARHVRWVSPYGILGLLAAGAAWTDRTGERPLLEVPESKEVVSYLDRIRFFERAHEVFDFKGHVRRRGSAESDALLEITPIRSHEDVHDVVEYVRERAFAILGKQLGYSALAVMPFSVILSEVCQNIIEHAGAGGWVSAQKYNWKRRLGRLVVVIAVVDVGMGFRGSLAREHAQRLGDRWSDQTALEEAFLHGTSRHRDPGRGQGIQGIRNQVSRWKGLMTIRSGTAQIADPCEWADVDPMIAGLPDFPGAQIQVVVPQVVPQNGGKGERGNG